MACFADLPSEVVDSVLEHLDQGSLSSTAIVASSLQYPSERVMYRIVKFRFFHGLPSKDQTTPAQVAFLRTVSLSERRARYVNLLSMTEIDYEGEERAARFQELEKAMRLMVNLDQLSILGAAHLQYARLESATFSLTHLFIHPSYSPGDPDTNNALIPILKAHPMLKWLSLHGVWSFSEDDAAAIEEQKCGVEERSSSVLCPRLEYVDSSREEILQSLFFGRRLKHAFLIRNTDRAGVR